MLIIKKIILIPLFFLSFIFIYSAAYAQNNNLPDITISAKDLYEGLKNKSLNFDYNQIVTITGILKDTGSSIIYNSSYLLISDNSEGYVYVKAVLADKNKRKDYINGQEIKINCRFYEERDKVVVVKDSKNVD